MESYDECSSMYSSETIIWPPINFLCSLERLWGIPKEVVKVCKQIDSTVLFALLDDGTEIYDFQPKGENVPNLLRGGIQIYNSAPLTNNPLISAMEQSTSVGMASPMEPQTSTAIAPLLEKSTLAEMASSLEPSTSDNEWSLHKYLQSILEIPFEDAIPEAQLVEQPPSMEPSTSDNEWSLRKYLQSILEIPFEDAVPEAQLVEQPPMPSRRQPSRRCKRPFNYKYNF